MTENINDIFRQYDDLLAYLKAYEESLLAALGQHIACAKGCSMCCELETLSPLEAHLVSMAVQELDDQTRQTVAEQAIGCRSRCPLLVHDSCAIYASRPVICRTHGYPLLVDDRVDFCPMNFTECDRIDSGYILNLEALNEVLAELNIHYALATGSEPSETERCSVAEICLQFVK